MDFNYNFQKPFIKSLCVLLCIKSFTASYLTSLPPTHPSKQDGRTDGWLKWFILSLSPSLDSRIITSILINIFSGQWKSARRSSDRLLMKSLLGWGSNKCWVIYSSSLTGTPTLVYTVLAASSLPGEPGKDAGSSVSGWCVLPHSLFKNGGARFLPTHSV